jgi:hypothetical protein
MSLGRPHATPGRRFPIGREHVPPVSSGADLRHDPIRSFEFGRDFLVGALVLQTLAYGSGSCLVDRSARMLVTSKHRAMEQFVMIVFGAGHVPQVLGAAIGPYTVKMGRFHSFGTGAEEQLGDKAVDEYPLPNISVRKGDPRIAVVEVPLEKARRPIMSSLGCPGAPDVSESIDKIA